MLPPRRARATNRLLEALPGSDLRHVLAAGETVELVFADVLYASQERLEHVYFPVTSFISMVMPVDDSSFLEVGLVGNEGMFGIPLVLGVDRSPVHAVVQGAGVAFRVDSAAFRRELDRSEPLRRGIDRYVYIHLTQLAQTAACTRFHVVEARLARWLLMTQDRAHTGTFHVTHDFLSFMLGVRRVGVTKAANALQTRRLIRYKRGDITVLDRRGLEAASCPCYQADRTTYERFFRSSFGGRARLS